MGRGESDVLWLRYEWIFVLVSEACLINLINLTRLMMIKLNKCYY